MGQQLVTHQTEKAMSKELVLSQPSSIETAERKFELMQRQAQLVQHLHHLRD
jgi:hypothetical protein